MEEMSDSLGEAMPFDTKRMAVGGFETLVNKAG
jgi:uncharacterized protein YbaA (DUF1428 family)